LKISCKFHLFCGRNFGFRVHVSHTELFFLLLLFSFDVYEKDFAAPDGSFLARSLARIGYRETRREREREREKKSTEDAVTRLLVAEATREREFAPVFATFSSSCQTTTTTI
jgi:hypothetical protein